MTTNKHPISNHVRNHEWCLLCGEKNPLSAKLKFQTDKDGGITASFRSYKYLQGYSGIVHGGVIAALLDAAMTHCLFHHNRQGLTCDLHVRYLHPVPCEANLEIKAWILTMSSRLFKLKAEIIEGERVMAWAEAKFLAMK